MSGQAESDPNCRIYVGNLLYSATPEDIEGALSDQGLAYEKVHLSTDSASGRNPGYCFVEFADPATAEQALQSLDGVEIYGRLVKVGPCQPKQSRDQQQQQRYGGGDGGRRNDGRNAGYNRPTTERWGDWRGSRGGAGDGDAAYGQGGYRGGQVSTETPQRLYLGGLGPLADQEQNDAEIREILKDYEIDVIGKRITPHESTRSQPGSYHYCFVDMASPEEALRAMNDLNGIEYGEGMLKVSLATRKRHQNNNYGNNYNNNNYNGQRQQNYNNNYNNYNNYNNGGGGGGGGGNNGFSGDGKNRDLGGSSWRRS